jgi:hypothetical protein
VTSHPLLDAYDKAAKDLTFASPARVTYEGYAQRYDEARANLLAALQLPPSEGRCFECGHELHAPFCPACNPEMIDRSEGEREKIARIISAHLTHFACRPRSAAKTFEQDGQDIADAILSREQESGR